MSYLELIQKALKGRSVNKTAKEWGIAQKTLEQYTKGRMPSFEVAKIMAEEAGIDLAEAFVMLANEEQNRKKSTDILSKSFNSLLRVANIFAYKKAQMA